MKNGRSGLRGGRIRKMADNFEKLTIDMQTFCLNPSLEKYNQIIDSLSRDENINIWSSACAYKYGYTITDDFIARESELCRKILCNPSKSSSISVLYIYFATGELKYIDLFYQCMGHELLPISTRQYLAQLYKNTKDLYNDKISELMTTDRSHFEKHNINISHIDFTYFDNIGSRAAVMREDEKMINN